MNYVQLHLGDWIAGTLDLTPTERGVYMDLLVRYYKEERPLMQDECKRIARGYAPVEQEAMQYVLQRFFTLDEAGYHQARCDEEIKKAQAVSTKRKNAAASRWAKKSDFDASAYPNEKQMESTCNAIGVLTNNHKPITNNQEINEEDRTFQLESQEGDSQKKTPKRETAKSILSKLEKPEDCSDKDWEDWVAFKKKKSKDCTQRMADALVREAHTAGITTGEAICIQLENGWSSFQAEYLHGRNNRSAAPKSPVDIPPIDYHRGINPDGSF